MVFLSFSLIFLLTFLLSFNRYWQDLDSRHLSLPNSVNMAKNVFTSHLKHAVYVWYQLLVAEKMMMMMMIIVVL